MKAIRILFYLVIIIVLFAACPGSGDSAPTTPTPTSTPSPATATVIEITADIDSVTTWQTGSVYLIRAWDFYVNNTLTIEPGVIIKFHPSDGPYMMLGGSGTIIANGSEAQPVIFTSYKDDAHGGGH